MTCNQCTTRLLRLAADVAHTPTTPTSTIIRSTTTRRPLPNRFSRPPYTPLSIRHTSSSAPRNNAALSSHNATPDTYSNSPEAYNLPSSESSTELTIRKAEAHSKTTTPSESEVDSSEPILIPPITAAGKPDILAIYNAAKQRPPADKNALSAWSASWKPETSWESLRSASGKTTFTDGSPATASGVAEPSTGITHTWAGTGYGRSGAVGGSQSKPKQASQPMSFDFLDDWQAESDIVTGVGDSLSKATEGKGKMAATEGDEWSPSRRRDALEGAMDDLNSDIYADEVDMLPQEIARKFPTRQSQKMGASSAQDFDEEDSWKGLTEEDTSRAEYDIPWNDPEVMTEKIKRGHDAEVNSWRDLSTPELWKRDFAKERMRKGNPENMGRWNEDDGVGRPNIRAEIDPRQWRKKLATDKLPGAEQISAAQVRKRVAELRAERPDAPDWLIHKVAVKEKLGGAAWNPRSRLSPAAVATLKQLKEENPDMSVEEYAPLFEISPDAMRRILRSKWTPTIDQEKDRLERWEKRGTSIWGEWIDKGLVEPKGSRKQKMRAEAAVGKTGVMGRSGGPGLMVRQKVNMKGRIL